MAQKFLSPICVWYFNLNNDRINDWSAAIHLRSYGVFALILRILQEEQIFILTKIRPHSIGEKEKEIDVENLNMIELLFLIENMLKKESLLFFTGKTMVKCNSGDYWEEGIVNFSYGFKSFKTNVYIYSDIWLPIDNSGKLQIDLAELNMGRLFKTLLKIKSLGFNEILPNEGDDYWDELYPQHGFKPYLDDGYLTFFDDSTQILNEEQITIIKKYLWSNRK